MSWLYKKGIKDGLPWFDYKAQEKTNPDAVFIFKIEDFMAFILYEICVTYDAVATSGNAQLPMKVTLQSVSTQLQFTPIPIAVNLLSSPSENYRLGALDEDAQGMRLCPVMLNYPCGIGDSIIVTVSGDPTRLTVGCMISGRKYQVNYAH